MFQISDFILRIRFQISIFRFRISDYFHISDSRFQIPHYIFQNSVSIFQFSVFRLLSYFRCQISDSIFQIYRIQLLCFIFHIFSFRFLDFGFQNWGLGLPSCCCGNWASDTGGTVEGYWGDRWRIRILGEPLAGSWGVILGEPLAGSRGNRAGPPPVPGF